MFSLFTSMRRKDSFEFPTIAQEKSKETKKKINITQMSTKTHIVSDRVREEKKKDETNETW